MTFWLALVVANGVKKVIEDGLTPLDLTYFVVVIRLCKFLLDPCYGLSSSLYKRCHCILAYCV